MAKILTSLPNDLLLDIDKYCKEHRYNRSEFLRFASRTIIYDASKTPVISNEILKNLSI